MSSRIEMRKQRENDAGKEEKNKRWKMFDYSIPKIAHNFLMTINIYLCPFNGAK